MNHQYPVNAHTTKPHRQAISALIPAAANTALGFTPEATNRAGPRGVSRVGSVPAEEQPAHTVGVVIREVRGDLQEQRHATTQHRHQYEP